jgi:transcriptional regulator with XRE-family HTH domain
MIYETDFGQFISEQKRKHSLQSKELAEMLGISMGYLSQLEHGKRVCPDQELLKKMIEVFNLNEEERIIIFDLYEKASGKLSPDIVEYVQSKDIIKKALRAAKSVNATDSDWKMFIDAIKNEQ